MEKSLYKKMSKVLEDFYPTFEKFLNESKQTSGSLPKIPTSGTVKAADGTMIDMKEVDKEMESAKTAIVSQSPLFAPYVHQFTPIYTWLVPTMATDGIRLFVNPKFAMELTWEQKIFVIIHEIMHCVLLHMDRGKSLDPELFNIAADLEINPLIVDTIDFFKKGFVEEMGGLYDEKYLNQPVEQIYKELASKGGPKLPKLPNNQGGQHQEQGQGQGQGQDQGQGSGGGGGNQPPQIEVGSKVRIKATGEEGVVTAVNPDGTFEIEPVTESFYPKFGKMLVESYARDEIIPIIEGPPNKGGGGDAESQGAGGQQEDTRSESEKKYDEENMPGMSGTEYEVIYREMENADPAGTGSIISKEQGDKIAEKSGYDVEGGESGASDVNPGEKWSDLSGKMYSDMKASKQAGSGKGGGLLKRLSELHKSDVNWKSIFKRAVAKALSPEMKYKVPHKKHIGKPYVLRGTYQKRDAIKHIVVAVDVSGSMSDKTLERIINEVNALIFTRKVKKITLLPFDGDVDESNIQTITRTGKAVIKEYRGPGGGTNFQAPLDWVHEHLKDSVSLLVFFTDGYASMPKKPPYAEKFIWMVYDNESFQKPFGQLVKLETDS